MQTKYMKNKLIKIAVLMVLLFATTIPSTFVYKVQADGLCDFVPCANVGGCPNGDCASAYTDAGNLIRLGLTLVFILIIVLGVALIIRAAVKIVRSEGDKDKMQEGIENIRGVFFGIIVIFVGIIGIIVISILFNATNIFQQNPEDPPLIDLPII